MDLQKLTFPLMIAAAIVGLWVILRPKPQAAVSNQVSAAPAGLPNYVPQAQTYQVNPPQLAAPSHPIVLADPYNPNPGQKNSMAPPAYLAFNFGPGHDLSKIPLTPEQLSQMNGNRAGVGGSCGCGGGCGGNILDCSADVNMGIYPDGRGALMAKNGRELVGRLNRQDPGWLNRAAYNLAGSDVLPQSIPTPQSNLREQALSMQPGSATPATPTSELAVSSPGSNAVNEPRISFLNALNPWRSNAVTKVVGSAYARVTQVGNNLSTFGHQVPELPADFVQQLSNIPMAG